MSVEIRQLVNRMKQLKMDKERLDEITLSQEYPEDYQKAVVVKANKIAALKAEIQYLSTQIADEEIRLEDEIKNDTNLISKIEPIERAIEQTMNDIQTIEQTDDYWRPIISTVGLDLITPKDNVQLLLISLKNDKKQLEADLQYAREEYRYKMTPKSIAHMKKYPVR